MNGLNVVGKDILTGANQPIPEELQNSRTVYLCNNWGKICFVVTILLIFLLREIFLVVTEDNILNMLYLISTNHSIGNKK